jgi:cytochrome d ubiquinol oxidase subunit I
VPLFWSFRVMVGCGFFFIALFAFSFWLASRRELDLYRWYLRIAAWSLPLPWVAAEVGWFVAEHGRQPWAIYGVLPTFLGSSSVAAGDVWFSLGGFVLFYTALAVVDVYLMVRAIRIGPEIVGDHIPTPKAPPQSRSPVPPRRAEGVGAAWPAE